MFDAETVARLRVVFDEVCKRVSCHETGVRAHVAAKILEAAAGGETSVVSLMKVGREALISAWRSAVHQ
jgi:hypothetical protein